MKLRMKERTFISGACSREEQRTTEGEKERVCASVGITGAQIVSVGPQRDPEVKRVRTKTETGFV